MLMALIEYEVNDGVDAECRSTLGGLLLRVATIDGFLGAYPASSLTHTRIFDHHIAANDPKCLRTQRMETGAGCIQDYKDLLFAFHAHGVRYCIVGGYAVIFHAQPRFTKDISKHRPQK